MNISSLKDIQHIFAKQNFTIFVCGSEQRADSMGRFVVVSLMIQTAQIVLLSVLLVNKRFYAPFLLLLNGSCRNNHSAHVSPKNTI